MRSPYTRIKEDFNLDEFKSLFEFKFYDQSEIDKEPDLKKLIDNKKWLKIRLRQYKKLSLPIDEVSNTFVYNVLYGEYQEECSKVMSDLEYEIWATGKIDNIVKGVLTRAWAEEKELKAAEIQGINITNLEDETSDSNNFSDEDQIERKEVLELIYEKLPADGRLKKVFVMTLHGYDVEEIADYMKVSIGSIYADRQKIILVGKDIESEQNSN